MNGYTFNEFFRASRELRAREVAAFLHAIQKAFDIENWISNSVPVETDEHSIQARLSAAVDAKIDGAGACFVLSSAGVRTPVLAYIGTGRLSAGEDFLMADFSTMEKIPEMSFFRRAICDCHPREAYLAQNENERRLKAYERAHEQAISRPDSERPSILRWFHYLDKQVAKTVGGISHCLMTPAYRVEPFCEGVLFQLTEKPLEPDNPQHQEIQIRAMRHLGLEP